MKGKTKVIQAFIFQSDNQDGSASNMYFKDEESMEKFAEKQGQRYCEDTSIENFVIENGVLKPISGFDG
jgi:hypothetical protein